MPALDSIRPTGAFPPLTSVLAQLEGVERELAAQRAQVDQQLGATREAIAAMRKVIDGPVTAAGPTTKPRAGEALLEARRRLDRGPAPSRSANGDAPAGAPAEAILAALAEIGAAADRKTLLKVTGLGSWPLKTALAELVRSQRVVATGATWSRRWSLPGTASSAPAASEQEEDARGRRTRRRSRRSAK